MNKYRVSFAMLATAMGLGIVYLVVVARASAAKDSQLPKIVYVDFETEEVFLLSARSTPADRPDTGEPTLIPGMYCEKCQAWKPVGSIEKLRNRGSVRNCPIHKTPLSREGPLPKDLQQ